MISRDKVTEIFCIIDELCKIFEAENAEKLLITSDDRRRRRRSASMSDSEIMTILLQFHFESQHKQKYIQHTDNAISIRDYYPTLS